MARSQVWQRRITGLKRPRRVPEHRILALREGACWTLDPDTGTVDSRPARGLATLIEFCSATGVQLLVTAHPGMDLLRAMVDSGTIKDLNAEGFIVKPFGNNGKTVGMVVSPTDDPDGMRKKERVEIWDIGTYYADMCKHSESGQSAVSLIAKRWKELCDHVESHLGTRPEMTPARTGFTAWRLTFTGVLWKKSKQSRTESRKAFHGGYTRSFRTGQESRRCKQYDINSAYPAAMRMGVPAGKPVYVGANADSQYADVPGLYEVEAILPPDSPGILLFHQPDRTPRPDESAEPLGGTYATLWTTSRELALFRRIGGVARVLRGWVYPDGIAHDFDAVVDTFEGMRGSAPSKALQAASKLIQNSTWGSMARKETVQEIVLSERRPDAGDGEPWFPHIVSTGELSGAWARHKRIDDDPRQQIAIAAWITASVRIKLVETILAVGAEHVIYCDTDSIVVDESVTLDTGTGYGEWKLEKVYSVYRPYGGKRYEGITIDGEHVVKAAGIAVGVLTVSTLTDLYELEPLTPPPKDENMMVVRNMPNTHAAPPQLSQ